MYLSTVTFCTKPHFIVFNLFNCSIHITTRSFYQISHKNIPIIYNLDTDRVNLPPQYDTKQLAHIYLENQQEINFDYKSLRKIPLKINLLNSLKFDVKLGQKIASISVKVL